MNNDDRITLLEIPLVEEKYGLAAMVSMAVHAAALLVLVFGVKLFPHTVIQLGSGQGGGFGGDDISTVGVVDQFSGGAGMFKPSMIPQPPALVPTPEKELSETSKIEENAIPIPEKIDQPKKKEPETKPAAKPEPKSDPKPEPKPDPTASTPVAKSTAKPKESPPPLTDNVIPVDARPGSGGVAGTGAGSGGGIGISIGAGSGGIGDSFYAQAVERRISAGWLRPPEGMRVDVTCSFFISARGKIYDIKSENSSGNPQIDQNVLRAIRAASPLSPPPREFQGKAIKFIARFVHPPNN